ncbi:uncharacterized protein Dana_GF13137, isoform A [Drosophila ananassae]|uniref:Uncharacterized protein, isoform A n=1 Tax=Drosophila ananassae TaxID=7217 RepID=B3MGN1_DROAN|nr:uncharacterized protein LOC6495980 isoform X1 [Drosophila ananassae]EDV36789.1 uncharacterized protein Dana_GF13137, isoform A [Drosophila ananassae]
MFSTHRLMLSCFYLCVLLSVSQAIEESSTDIEEDVIKIQNETQKVIRVHPHDLPPKKDNTGSQINSALFQIQTLRPGSAGGSSTGSPRQYVDSKQMRKRRPRPAKLLREDGVASGEDATLPAMKYPLKAFPKQKLKQQKELRFDPSGDGVSQGEESQVLPVQMTPGPYPIYYVVSKTNGRFGKFPIKSFGSPAEFSKYLVKSKAEPITRSQRFEVIL